MEGEKVEGYFARDRLVSRYAARQGFSEEQVFHSPIESHLGLFLITLLMALPLTYAFGWLNTVLIALVLGAAPWYLLAGYLNHCFIVGPTELIVLNRNPPWWRTKKIKLTDIEQVYLRKSLWLQKLTIPLLLFGEGQYVEVITHDKATQRFFCVGLEPDYFDENMVGNRMEDFERTLREQGVTVTLEEM